MADHLRPDRIHWCNGSQQEYDSLCQLMVDKGTLSNSIRKNDQTVLHVSAIPVM
jgi:GTP-dependent phosphoenolpyruvate carboxykinase